MKSIVFILFIAGLTLSVNACAQEDSETAAAARDVAVHAAEVASATAPTFDERVANGERLYLAQCSACHQANGAGLPGAFPPLTKSDYFAEDSMKAVTAVINGLSGP